MNYSLLLMIIDLVILLIVLAETRYSPGHRNIRQVAVPCRTPDNEAGNCISIKKCQSLMELLSPSANNKTVLFLRQSQCGIENKLPKVCCPTNTTVDSKIKPEEDIQCGISGIKASKIPERYVAAGDWPWMVALGYIRADNTSDLDFKCGATLISNNYVLAPAHCVDTGRNFRLSVARLGDVNLDPAEQDRATPVDIRIKMISVHPEYSKRPLKNDIAVIQLNDSVHFDKNIRPICLLSGDVYKNDSFYVRKWPFTIGYQDWTKNLHESPINMVDHQTCAKIYANYSKNAVIDEKVLCAGGRRNDDVCQDDFSSALMFPFPHTNDITRTRVTFYLGGIKSFGFNCFDDVDHPIIYTRVAQFIDWINQVTGEHF